MPVPGPNRAHVMMPAATCEVRFVSPSLELWPTGRSRRMPSRSRWAEPELLTKSSKPGVSSSMAEARLSWCKPVHIGEGTSGEEAPFPDRGAED